MGPEFFYWDILNKMVEIQVMGLNSEFTTLKTFETGEMRGAIGAYTVVQTH